MNQRVEANRPGGARGSRAVSGGPPETQGRAIFRKRPPILFGGPPKKARGPRALPSTLAVMLTLFNTVCAGEQPVPSPPDRREIWVPADQLDLILKKNPKAVLLSREQYETLLRDAKSGLKSAPQSPRRAALGTARYHAQLAGNVVHAIANFSVTVLTDEWAELPFAFEGVSLEAVRFDGDTALKPAAESKTKAVRSGAGQTLLVRGRGEHQLAVDFTIPVQHSAGTNKIDARLPQAVATIFNLELPPNVRVESDKPLTVKKAADKTSVAIASSAAEPDVRLSWRATGEAGAGAAVLSQVSNFLYVVDAERVRADLGIVLNAALGKIPATVNVSVPAGAKVLQAEGAEIAKWSLAGDDVTVEFTPGDRTVVGFRLLIETLSSQQTATKLPVPRVAGVGRVAGAFVVMGTAGITVRDIKTDALTIQTEGAFEPAIEQSPSFIAAYKFLALPDSPMITVNKVAPRLDADLDTLVEFQQEAIFIERTITLHERDGEIFSTALAVPAEEEVLTVQHPDGSEPDWRLDNKKVVIRWSDHLAPGESRIFKIRSRIEPAGWTQFGAEGIAFSLVDARIENAEKVTGYIALKADPSFRVETELAEALESRDGRQTPVRGDFAWFRRQDFQLKTKVTKRAPELQATVIGYALPMENLLDLHAQMDFKILYSGIRKVRIKVPASHAAQFHFDGQQIAERKLDGDTWTISFQKEISGNYALAISAQLPIEKNRDDASRFAIEVPVIAPLDVPRVNGAWAVEANTETEISFKSAGMNELDTLSAPALAGYQPKHRVIGVFGWIGSTYSLALEGVRHEATPILTTIVDRLELASVIATSGAERHLATYSLRTAGEQFLDVELPPGSKLWSLSVDEQLVKPVSHKRNTVRVELPAKLETGSALSVSFLYETTRREWSGAGSQELVAPKLSDKIPILQSRWQVFLPDGFSYRKFASNLPVQIESRESALISLPWRWLDAFVSSATAKPEVAADGRNQQFDVDAAWNKPVRRFGLEQERESGAEASRLMESKLSEIIISKVEFRDTPLREAIRSLGQQAGVRTVLKLDPAVSEPARITLSLSNISSIEALRYVTGLANLKIKIEPDAVLILPFAENTDTLVTKEYRLPPGFIPQASEAAKGGQAIASRQSAREFLETQGVQFPAGATANYLASNGKLIVRNTQSNLDLMDTLVDAAIAAPQTPLPPKTAGLLPMKLDLPLAGQPVLFEGLFAPERVSFSYIDWRGRARRIWIWFVVGGVAFLFLGQRRPWTAMLWGMLALTFVPLCVAASTTVTCNAILAGWLVAFVLQRLAGWFVIRSQRDEVRAI